MKCKECREKIPDNVKYCPECGALVNEHGGSFSYYRNNGNNNSRQNEQTYQFPLPQFTERKKASGNIPFIRILFFVFIFIFGASVLLSSFNRVTDLDISDSLELWNDSEVVVIDENLNSVENSAFDYVANIVDCEAFQSTDTFRTQTLIDWDLVCRDYFRNRTENGATASAMSEDELYAESENCLRAVFESINSRYDEDFEPFNFYITTLGVYSVSVDQNSFYHSLISSYLTGFGLDAGTYYDRYQINNVYCVEFSVAAEDINSEAKHDFGNVQVIVAEIYDDYYVLYDDVYIQTLLDSIN